MKNLEKIVIALIAILFLALTVKTALAEHETLCGISLDKITDSSGTRINLGSLDIAIGTNSGACSDSIFAQNYSNQIANGSFVTQERLNLSFNQDYYACYWIEGEVSPVLEFQCGQGQIESGDLNTTDEYSVGSLGIGTESPSQELHVNKTQNGATRILVENEDTGSSAVAGIQFDAQTANLLLHSNSEANSAERCGITLAGWNEILSFTGNGLLVNTQASSPIVFGTGNSGRMRIEADGGVSFNETIRIESGEDVCIDEGNCLSSVGESSAGNPFDQSLNTTDGPTFNNLTISQNVTFSGRGTHLKNIEGLIIPYVGSGKNWIFRYDQVVAADTGMNFDEVLGRVNLFEYLGDVKTYVDGSGNFWTKGNLATDGRLIQGKADTWNNLSAKTRFNDDVNISGNLQVNSIGPEPQDTPEPQVTINNARLPSVEFLGDSTDRPPSGVMCVDCEAVGEAITHESVYDSAVGFWNTTIARWKKPFFFDDLINVSKQITAERFNGKIDCSNIDGGSDSDYCEDSAGGSSVSIYTQEYQFYDKDGLPYGNRLEQEDNQVNINTGLPIRQNGTIVGIKHATETPGTCTVLPYVYVVIESNTGTVTNYQYVNITLGAGNNRTNSNGASGRIDDWQQGWVNLEVTEGNILDLKGPPTYSCSPNTLEHIFAVIVKTNSSMIP